MNQWLCGYFRYQLSSYLVKILWKKCISIGSQDGQNSCILKLSQDATTGKFSWQHYRTDFIVVLGLLHIRTLEATFNLPGYNSLYVWALVDLLTLSPKTSEDVGETWPVWKTSLLDTRIVYGCL
ncbi:uncharacterized protein LOC111309961 [Durio zibethinus]|uniref:Uncharacterized protein LOC111309961 n=1 Tax=Durio zibethinus TaxID=66656 RepID=A0A6P6AIL9_DURZI|nr:uncharacterized protein LOC111309961 [Durio zibethinus]XP_022764733.1 uncharacterized protein LOC111309961 [Durio zibethinus]